MIVEVLHSPKSQFEFTQKDTCFESNRIQLKNNTVINKDFHQRYRWRFSDGNNLSNNNPGPRKYADTGKYSILLIYDNNNGCSDTNTQYVNIKPNPDANFSFVNGIYCSLDSIKFTANTSSPYLPLSHEWKFSDSSSLNGPIVNKSFSGFGTYRIQLKSTAITGCTDTISQSIFVNC
jgi:PKD repeat protein